MTETPAAYERYLVWRSFRGTWQLHTMVATWSEAAPAYLEALACASGEHALITEYIPVSLVDGRQAARSSPPQPDVVREQEKQRQQQVIQEVLRRQEARRG